MTNGRHMWQELVLWQVLVSLKGSCCSANSTMRALSNELPSNQTTFRLTGTSERRQKQMAYCYVPRNESGSLWYFLSCLPIKWSNYRDVLFVHQQPRGLRHRSAVARLPELRFRISLRGVDCRPLCFLCVVLVAAYATGCALVQSSPTERVFL